MRQSFLYGVLLAVLLFTLGLLTKPDLFVMISGGIGLGCLLIGGLLSGAFVDGDQIRANFATESSSDRKKRNNVMINLVAFGAPNFVVAILLVLIFS